MKMYGWQRYLGIEKDFLDAQFYISFDIKDAYSEFFSREVILLGSEIEASFKTLCEMIKGPTPGNIKEYKTIILGEYPGIENIKIKNKQTDGYEKPFKEWGKEGLTWWDVYTRTKHNLVDTDATLGTALTMLQAYELLLYCISATMGNFEMDYLESPRLFIPEFDPGFRLTVGMRGILRYDAEAIRSILRAQETIASQKSQGCTV